MTSPAQNNTKAYIGLIPVAEDAKRLVVENGLAQDDLHATVVFLGEANQYTQEMQNNIISSAQQTANSFPLVTANGFSIDLFNPNTPDKKTCIVLGLSSSDLCEVEDDLSERITENLDTMIGPDTALNVIPEQPEPWIPHVTLIYTEDASLVGELANRVGPITFDRIRVQFADKIVDIPLSNVGEGASMGNRATYLVDLESLQLSEDGSKWVHALPIGSFTHPVYGPLNITAERATKFADSVKQKVRGIEPSINYDHNNSGDAAGWVKDAEARANGLWLFIEWTKTAYQKIKELKYKYFSIEFDNEWQNAEGKTFNDVIFGGALTNRPFMKNLVPINLSEANLTQVADVFAALTGKEIDSLKGGTDSMDLNEEQINGIVEKLAAKLGEKITPPVPPVADPLKLSEIEELKQLSEENPLVKALIHQVESQGVSIVDTQKQLRETEIGMRLAEFDKSKLVLTPVAKKLVYGLLTEMPVQLHESFWKLMDHMRKSQSFLVDLSERAGVNVKYGVDRSPSKRFNELVNKELASGKDYATAVELVAKDNRELYDEYRQESFSFQA